MKNSTIYFLQCDSLLSFLIISLPYYPIGSLSFVFLNVETFDDVIFYLTVVLFRHSNKYLYIITFIISNCLCLQVLDQGFVIKFEVGLQGCQGYQAGFLDVNEGLRLGYPVCYSCISLTIRNIQCHRSVIFRTQFKSFQFNNCLILLGFCLYNFLLFDFTTLDCIFKFFWHINWSQLKKFTFTI